MIDNNNDDEDISSIILTPRNGSNKYIITLNRTTIKILNTSVEESKRILNVNNILIRVVRLKYITLARKYHPDKWYS